MNAKATRVKTKQLLSNFDTATSQTLESYMNRYKYNSKMTMFSLAKKTTKGVQFMSYEILPVKKSFGKSKRIYYTIVDSRNSKALYENIALVDAAFALVRNLIFSKNSYERTQIVKMDESYDQLLFEAYMHKQRCDAATTLNDIELFETKKVHAYDKALYLKSQIALKV